MTAGTDWWDQARRLVEGFRAPPPEAATDCRWCPLCQAAAVLRGERPEVTAALADILTSAAAALRQFAGEDPASRGTEEPGGEGASRPGPTVQRIDVG